MHKVEIKLFQQISMETKQRLSAIQHISEQITLLQPQQQQMIRRTSSTTPVPATPTNRVRPHRKLHNRHRLYSASSHDHAAAVLMQQNETQGLFTSAPATPESQQNLIVQNDHSSPVLQDYQHTTDEILPVDTTTIQCFSTDQHSPTQHSPTQINKQPTPPLQADQTSPTHSSN